MNNFINVPKTNPFMVALMFIICISCRSELIHLMAFGGLSKEKNTSVMAKTFILSYILLIWSEETQDSFFLLIFFLSLIAHFRSQNIFTQSSKIKKKRKKKNTQQWKEKSFTTKKNLTVKRFRCYEGDVALCIALSPPLQRE